LLLLLLLPRSLLLVPSQQVLCVAFQRQLLAVASIGAGGAAVTPIIIIPIIL
jgi:hypothetical protein